MKKVAATKAPVKVKVKASETPMHEMEEKEDGMDKYEIENAARTLLDAEKIKGNEKLYKAALAKVKENRGQADAVLGGKKITSIEELKKASYEAED